MNYKVTFIRKTLVYLAQIVLAIVGLFVLFHVLPTGHDTYPLPTAPITATMPEATTPPIEGEPGFDCRINGNHVCGPGSGQPAGCYVNGVMSVPWTNYTDPKLDPLWAQYNPPC